MPRKLLLFAALAVAGSMLVLWLVTRETAAEEPTATGADDTPQVADSRDRDRDRDRMQPSLPADPDPARTRPPPSGDNRNPRNVDPGRPHAGTVEHVDRGTHAGEAKTEPLEYTLPDGRKVRDFRSPANRRPLDLPPSIHAPGGRRIQPELTGLFTEQILAHMRACGKAVPKSALGSKPRLEGQIVIAIEEEQGTVTNAVFKLTDVNDATIAETVRQCVEQKTLTVQVPAANEQDLDAYSINLSFAFP